MSAGVNWKLTSRCAGNLGLTLAKSPAEITELVATGVNYLTTTSVAETGKCAVSNGYSLLFNSSLTNDTNSNPIDALNNARTAMIEAGVEYAKGPSTLTALASISDTSYNDRGAATTTLGLATEVNFHTFSLNYTRQINTNLSVTGLIGLVGVTSGFGIGLPKSLLPIYTLSMSWAFTPKLTLTGTGSRTVAPPIAVIANAEIDYTGEMNLIYQVTPKVGRQLRRRHYLHQCGVYPGFGGDGPYPLFRRRVGFLQRKGRLDLRDDALPDSRVERLIYRTRRRPFHYPRRLGHGEPELSTILKLQGWSGSDADNDANGPAMDAAAGRPDDQRRGARLGARRWRPGSDVARRRLHQGGQPAGHGHDDPGRDGWDDQLSLCRPHQGRGIDRRPGGARNRTTIGVAPDRHRAARAGRDHHLRHPGERARPGRRARGLHA